MNDIAWHEMTEDAEINDREELLVRLSNGKDGYFHALMEFRHGVFRYVDNRIMKHYYRSNITHYARVNEP